MTTPHGFDLIRQQAIPELNTTACLYRHGATGAELLSLSNDDENKCFGITFRTLPADSTGVAHILEHSVLCGSRRYQVKEPFKELLQGSLKTFLNAFTYPDRTVYPVASQNLQDFYNLIDVYLDAVFHPLLTSHAFSQEGWHYEIDDAGQLAYSGVVFNEMKGAYGSPDDLLETAVLTSLFPDNLYGFESGGDPAHIPDLSHEALLSFHRTHYHPANALIYFYGDDPTDARLQIIDRWLTDFDRLAVDATIPLHPPFTAPTRRQRPYTPGENAKTFVTVNWALADTSDPATDLALAILGHILIGTPASPLRKALIDSDLGEDLAGLGLMGELRQIVFSTGLKGVEDANIDAVETLVLDTLRGLATDGIDPRTVAASLNTVEFSLRENNTGGFPRGLALMLRGLTIWPYGGDPLSQIAFEQPLQAVKAAAAAEPRTFENLIQRYLLDNPHRVTLLLHPDPDLEARQQTAETARLAAARAAMTPNDLAAIRAANEELRRLQETPDSSAALAAIPRLALADLDRQNKLIPLTVLHEGDGRDASILYHDLFTNGIVYLDLGFDLRALPADLLPYVNLLGRALLETGAGEQDFVSLSQRIGSKTGGIHPSAFISARRDTTDPVARFFLRGKATAPQTPDLLAILRDVLLSARLDNRERIRQIVLEEKAGEEANLLPMGHAVVLSRLGAHFHAADWAAEQMGGISYLFFLRQLVGKIEQDWLGVLAKLETARSLLINRATLLANVTLDAANWAQVQPQLADFLADLPVAPARLQTWTPTSLPRYEGLTIPASVNYVGKGGDLYRLDYRLHGSTFVLANLLNTGWLWEQVRMQGGAYGAFFAFDQRSGVAKFASYRDPNLRTTLDAYDRAAAFLAGLDLGEDEMTRAIIGVIGQFGAHLLPDAKGWVSMQRYLLGESDAFRQQLRAEVLSTTPADFGAFVDALAGLASAGDVVVLGSETAIAQANAEGGLGLEVRRVM